MLPSTLARFLCLLPAVPLLANDWPEFRGPTHQGHADVRTAPLHWSATSNVVWSVPVPGEGWSSPSLFHGRLYLTTGVKPESGPGTLRVICLDARDGSTLWDTEAFVEKTAAGIHPKNGHASPTPLVEGDHLFAHFGHEGTARLGLDGKVQWRQTGIKYTPVHGNGGSPARVDDLLVFSADGADDPVVVGLDAATGAIRWKTPRAIEVKRHFSFCTPLVIEVKGRKQIVLPGSGGVFAYDPKDGHELWRARYGEGYSVIPRPVYANGLIYVGTGYDRPWIHAVRPDGEGDVTDTHTVWKLAKGAPNTPSLLSVGDAIYAVSDGGIASCLDGKTGEVRWSERLGGDFSASPVLAAGRIYFQNETGTGFVVEPGNTFRLLAKNELGAKTLASYAVDEGTFYIRTGTQLYKIGTGL